MTAATPTPTVRRLVEVSDEQVRGLAELLIDCIAGGAGVSFMHPLEPAKAEAFWHEVAEEVAAGRRALLVVEDDTGIAGTVQLLLAQPENQPHRADLAKMLVHRRARRQGLGTALMRAAERVALECGKTLLVLDTVTDSDADRLYTRLGWQPVGVIPGYSLMPYGGLTGTRYYYRELGA